MKESYYIICYLTNRQKDTDQNLNLLNWSIHEITYRYNRIKIQIRLELRKQLNIFEYI